MRGMSESVYSVEDIHKIIFITCIGELNPSIVKIGIDQKPLYLLVLTVTLSVTR